MKTNQSPYALIVEKSLFKTYLPKNRMKLSPEMEKMLTREEALHVMLKNLDGSDTIVGTTGFTSREVYEYRELNNQLHQSDFLCVGCMGHASGIALGVALAKPSRNVFCFDGDGASLMQMGSYAING